MPSTTYTQRLGFIKDAAVGLHTIGTVPVGNLWVIRDVVLVLDAGNAVKTINGAVLLGKGGAFIIAYVGPPNAVEQLTYHWEMRQVLNAGETLQLFSGDAGWSVLVSGYVFTSP